MKDRSLHILTPPLDTLSHVRLWMIVLAFTFMDEAPLASLSKRVLCKYRIIYCPLFSGVQKRSTQGVPGLFFAAHRRCFRS